MYSVFILQLLGVYASDVLAFVTIALVILTGFYAYQTKKTVQVLEKTANMEFLPMIKGQLHMIGPVNLYFQISNVGKASASDIKVKFVVIGHNTVERNWTQPLFTPNEFRDFPIPIAENQEESSVHYFQNNETRLQFTATYKDILGESHSNEEEINISDFVRQFQTTISTYDEETMDRISRSLKTISDEMRNITRNLSRIGNGLPNK